MTIQESFLITQRICKSCCFVYNFVTSNRNLCKPDAVLYVCIIHCTIVRTAPFSVCTVQCFIQQYCTVNCFVYFCKHCTVHTLKFVLCSYCTVYYCVRCTVYLYATVQGTVACDVQCTVLLLYSLLLCVLCPSIFEINP